MTWSCSRGVANTSPKSWPLLQSAKIGADVATMPPAVIKGLFKHILTDKGIEGFLADWAKTGQTIPTS